MKQNEPNQHLVHLFAALPRWRWSKLARCRPPRKNICAACSYRATSRDTSQSVTCRSKALKELFPRILKNTNECLLMYRNKRLIRRRRGRSFSNASAATYFAASQIYVAHQELPTMIVLDDGISVEESPGRAALKKACK